MNHTYALRIQTTSKSHPCSYETTKAPCIRILLKSQKKKIFFCLILSFFATALVAS